MNYIILGKDKTFVSPVLVSLHIIPEITVLYANKLLTAFLPKEKIFIQSESAIPPLLSHMVDTNAVKAIHTLNNKDELRELLKTIYPDFYFKKISIEEIDKQQLPSNRKYVIKPAKGFYGVGVRIIDDKTNLQTIKRDIQKEITKNLKFFTPTMISQDTFIIEEFIEGEEYAVDMYFTNEGTPVIMNIYHHPIPEDPRYLNTLYYTNRAIFDELYTPLIQFFSKLNALLHLKSFCIHAEFKYDKGKLFPIELNPLRYGGSGLADLTYYAFGIHPYYAFFTDTKPQWEKIWETRKKKYYGWVNAYNSKDINPHKYIPDHERFKQKLGKILHYYYRSYLNEPVFSCAYIEHTHKEKLYNVLNLNFSEYFVKR